MTKITRYAIALMSMLLPSFAFSANLFDIPSGDISIKVLGAVFGGLMENGGSDPLLSGIKMFNGGCLIIGGILAGYTILAGTLNTAHDGEMLGKKFSSVWIPIRYSVGTALVLPVVGGGYCVMQAIVMWLVIQGIGLADQVWTAFMSNPTAAASTNVRTNRDQVVDIAKSAFDASMCYRSYARAIADSKAGGTDLLNWGQYNYTMSKTSQGWVYGDSTSSVRLNGCGQINYPQDTVFSSNLQQDSTFVNNTPSSGSGYLGDIGTIFAPMDVTPIQKAHNTQLDALVKSMDTLASNVIATAKNGDGVALTPDVAAADYAQIETAADTYLAGVKSAADGLSTGDAFDKIKQTAGNQGWILAGAWFTRIVQMNDRVNKAVSSTPTDDGSVVGPLMDRLIFSDAKKYSLGSAQVLSNDKRAGLLARAGSFMTQGNDQTVNGNTGSSGWNFNFVANPLKWFEAKITEVLTGVNLYDLKNDPRHPLVVANELGNRLMVICTLMITALAAAAIGIARTVGTASDMTSAGLQVIGWLLDLPIKLLFGVGMGTAYILPNMPYIIWIGCIVGWVLLVIEAIIAAPLWAIMHLHPNGDDMTGRAGQGYSLVLSLLLRPVLMVFGMEAAIVISSVIGEFINKTFFDVFAQNTGTFTGITAVVALGMGTLVYFTVMFIFLKKCFGIIHQLPDQLLQWIGGGGSQLGQFASEFGGAADKAQGAAAGAAGFVVGGLGKEIGLGAVGKYVKNKDAANRGQAQNSIDRSDKQMDETLGKGTANQASSFASMRHDNSYKGMTKAAKNKEAFGAAISGVAGTDPEFGKQDFMDRFAASEADNHNAYGGDAALAAQSIGTELMSRNAESLPNSDFLSRAAPKDAGGMISGAQMSQATSTLSTLKDKIGATSANALISKAMASGKSGSSLIREAHNLYNTEFKGKTPTDPTPSSGGDPGKISE